MALPTAVEIREVGPRDGLQAEAPVPLDSRVALVEALLDAGARRIEACSFVSPRAVPSMAQGAELMGRLEPRRPGVVYAVLVPNLRGAQLALETHPDEITVIASASEVYNRRNINMSVEESVAAIAEIAAVAHAAGVPVDAVVSCAFGSPYEGDIAARDVRALADRIREAGADRLTFADTTGMATPRRVNDLVDSVGADVGLHLHDTRGTALVNAYAALEIGITRFDTSIGGLGGSPFAAGAGGNLATEDLVHMLDDLGVDTGISLEALLSADRLLEEMIGHPVASRVALAGPRSRLASG